MSTGTLAPYWNEQHLDDDGVPLAGGFIYTYAAGTSTPATTYFDNSIDPLSANTNPIELDSAGRCVIYLAATSYKFVLTDSLGVTIVTQDNITAVNAGASGLGEIFNFGGQSSTPVTLTSYPSGATFDTLHGGTAVFEEDSSNLSGTYKIQGTGVVSGSNTLTVAIVDLTDGAPDTPIATCAFTSTTGEVVTSSAITFPSPGATKQYGIKAKVNSGSGYAWGIALIRTA